MLFVSLFAWQALAYTSVISMRDSHGSYYLLKINEAGAGSKFDVYLDDEEISRIAAACKRQ